MKIGEGAFVWTNFPFGPPNQPELPGPMPHIAYCLGVQRTRRSVQFVLAYTSSGRWRGSGRLPLGVMEFGVADARQLNQKPFHLDLRVLARVPPGPDWFPYSDAMDEGIVAWAAPAMRDRIARQAMDLARLRPEVIEMRGPGAA